MHLRSHIKANQAQWVITHAGPLGMRSSITGSYTTTCPSAAASSSHSPATTTRTGSTTSPTPAPSMRA